MPSSHFLAFSKEHKAKKVKHQTYFFPSIADVLPALHPTFIMIRNISIALLALVVASTDAFKFMSNWQPPKILTDEQKVKIAQMEERFGDKSEFFSRRFNGHCYLWIPSDAYRATFLLLLNFFNAHRAGSHHWLFFWPGPTNRQKPSCHKQVSCRRCSPRCR
eukprot:scaffold4297_cov152-Skeletonema_menzelii.AAC.6